MRKGILILSMIWGVFTMGIAQDRIAGLLELNTLVKLDTLAELDTIEALPLITEQMQHAVVHQDSLVIRLMRDKRSGYVRGEQVIDGFRVQIYASNVQQKAKQEAFELHQRVEAQIDVPVYTLSEPPFWKVRIGNFHTREEANAYKSTFLELYPELTGSTYIVPDKIIIIQ